MLSRTVIRFPLADVETQPIRQLVLILQQTISNVVVTGFAVNFNNNRQSISKGKGNKSKSKGNKSKGKGNKSKGKYFELTVKNLLPVVSLEPGTI